MEKEYNPGFAFYKDFYEAIENLPIEDQKEICYAAVKYGITSELVDPAEMKMGYSMTRSWKQAIDNSVDRWRLNQNKANFKIDANMSRDTLIAKLIMENKNSREIAEEVSSITGKSISESTVRRSAPWLERNSENFDVKWLGGACKIAQNERNSEDENCENEREMNAHEREMNGSERSNVQNCTPFDIF